MGLACDRDRKEGGTGTGTGGQAGGTGDGGGQWQRTCACPCLPALLPLDRASSVFSSSPQRPSRLWP